MSGDGGDARLGSEYGSGPAIAELVSAIKRRNALMLAGLTLAGFLAGGGLVAGILGLRPAAPPAEPQAADLETRWMEGVESELIRLGTRQDDIEHRMLAISQMLLEGRGEIQIESDR